MISASCHTHIESPLTGSSLPIMIARAKELDRKYFTYTDNNHLSSALKTYKLAKNESLRPILGIEIYIKDNFLTGGTSADRCKYFTCTVYAVDRQAFQEICK